MKYAAVNIWLAIFIFIGISAIGIALQIYLSKRDSKYLGLILPIISLIISLATVIGQATYDYIGMDSVSMLDLFASFLISNIPTIVLLFIYFGIREKIKTRKQVDKMNIKDL